MDFKAPVRLVKEAADMDKWLNSEVSHVMSTQHVH